MPNNIIEAAFVVKANPFLRNELVRDISIITAFVASNYVIHKVAPHVRPTASTIIRHSGPYWDRLKERALQMVDAASGIRGLIRRTNENESFLRWIQRNLESLIFAPTPRVRQRLQGIISASTEEILRDQQIRPALSELEEFDDEGIIVAYAKTSDTESDIVEPTDSVPDFGFVDTWPNTNLTMKFEPWSGTGGCSTPMTYASPIHHWLATSVDRNPPVQFPTEDSAVLEANATKIATLEAELAKMKAMVEMILQNQTHLQNHPAVHQPVNLAEGLFSVRETKSKPPLPPPPPPPPPPAMSQPLTNHKVIKLKTKSELEPTDISSAVTAPTKVAPPSMSDILKGLGNVKLKRVERSPGGTPLKQNRSPIEMDPASMIAAALRKRFASIQSPVLSNVGEEDSLSDKENQPLDTSNDSFTRSPSFFQFGNSSNRKDKATKTTDSPVVLKRISSEHKLNTSVSKRRKSMGSPVEQPPMPMFGQHLLKRRVSNSLQKKQARLSLNEENN